MAQITTYFSSSGGGISGSGTATRIAYWSGASSITSDSELFYDPTNNRVSISAGTLPSASLTIKTEGITDASSAIRVYTQPSEAIRDVFRVYSNGRIDSSVCRSDDGDLTNTVAIGVNAGDSITTASECVFLGSGAGRLSVSNIGCTVAGNNAFYAGTGNYNEAYGNDSLRNCTSGIGNSGFGSSTLATMTTGTYSCALGETAGRYRKPGATDQSVNPTDGVYIGSGSRSGSSTTNVTNEIVIGKDAIGAGTNTATIGNATCSKLVVNGNIEPTNNLILASGKGIFFSGAGGYIGTTSSQKLAFWGKAPIAQPTTTISSAGYTAGPGMGSIIKTDDKLGGYTMGQVVQALINIGILT